MRGLSPLICLDLFHHGIRDVVKQTHGNLFLVPSLSPKTTAHESAASDLRTRLKASTFVCNRWLDHEWAAGRPATPEPEKKGTSFFQVPAAGGCVTHLGHRPAAPYLLFSLSEESARALGQNKLDSEAKFK